MKISGNTILITGGATGIGFALAEEFVKANNKVIICGRREEKLREAKNKIPELIIKTCDISKSKNREELFLWIVSNYPDINILVNNAGIQIMRDLKTGKKDLKEDEDETDINLKAPIHLAELFIPDFLKKDSAIINISSGLGFVPITSMPVYCATKAALHSFSISLRHQLKNTSIKIFEIIPPTVDTELDRGRRKTRIGISPSEVSKATLNALEKNIYEVPIGMAENLRNATKGIGFDENFNRMNLI